MSDNLRQSLSKMHSPFGLWKSRHVCELLKFQEEI